MSAPLLPPGGLAGDAPRLAEHERYRMIAVASHARRVHPGPLGELVARELMAFAEFGYRFGRDGLIARVAADVLAAPAAREE
jgi:hypothetical protein